MLAQRRPLIRRAEQPLALQMRNHTLHTLRERARQVPRRSQGHLGTSLASQEHIGISSWSSPLRAMVGRLQAQPGKQAAQDVIQLLGGVGHKGAFEATLLTQRLATLAIVGIGDLEPSQLLRNSGNYYTEDMRLLAERGAVGDICLRYFDAQGKPVLEEDEEFVVSVALPKLRSIHRVLGLAGGLNKVQAIRGALKGRYLDILITDLDTAQALNH